MDDKNSRNRSMAVKLLAGRGRSPRASLRGLQGLTGSSYQINSSQGSLASRRSRPRSLSDDRRNSQDLFESVALLTNGGEENGAGGGEGDTGDEKMDSPV